PAHPLRFLLEGPVGLPALHSFPTRRSSDLVASLGACRDYNFKRHVSSQDGLIPADQYARYGREQAIAVAIGREFARPYNSGPERSEEHTSELQSRENLVCRLLLEKKKTHDA